jgi:hypothetical protein
MDFLVSFQSASQDIRQPGTDAKTLQHNITSLLSRSPHLKMTLLAWIDPLQQNTISPSFQIAISKDVHQDNGAAGMNETPTTETTDMPLDNLTSFEIATFKGNWKVEVEYASKQFQELKSEQFQHLPR